MNHTSIDLKGHSGCKINIYKNSEGFLVVRKTSSSIDYNERLKLQMKKQNDFVLNQNENTLIKSVPVFLNGINSEGLFWFDMQYVDGIDSINYFSKVNTYDLSNVAENLNKFFKNSISRSKIVSAPEEKIISKVDELKQKLFKKNKFYSTIFSYLYTQIPNSEFYSNISHGDFSLTNLIFKNNEIFAVDFLDSFIESPIIDIVKLRQDTRIGRIFNINNNMDRYTTRSKISIKFIDDKIDKLINNDLILKSWHEYLQVLNLTRILPYTTNINELNFLKNQIIKIIES